MATDVGSNHAARFNDGLENWRNDMADYLDKKRNVQFEQPAYKKVTHEFIKA